MRQVLLHVTSHIEEVSLVQREQFLGVSIKKTFSGVIIRLALRGGTEATLEEVRLSNCCIFPSSWLHKLSTERATIPDRTLPLLSVSFSYASEWSLPQ